MSFEILRNVLSTKATESELVSAGLRDKKRLQSFNELKMQFQTDDYLCKAFGEVFEIDTEQSSQEKVFDCVLNLALEPSFATEVKIVASRIRKDEASVTLTEDDKSLAEVDETFAAIGKYIHSNNKLNEDSVKVIDELMEKLKEMRRAIDSRVKGQFADYYECRDELKAAKVKASRIAVKKWRSFSQKNKESYLGGYDEYRTIMVEDAVKETKLNLHNNKDRMDKLRALAINIRENEAGDAQKMYSKLFRVSTDAVEINNLLSEYAAKFGQMVRAAKIIKVEFERDKGDGK